MTADSQDDERFALRAAAHDRQGGPPERGDPTIGRTIGILRQGQDHPAIAALVGRPFVEAHRDRGESRRRPKRGPGSLVVGAAQTILAALAFAAFVRMHRVHLVMKVRARRPAGRPRNRKALALVHVLTAAHGGIERVPVEMEVNRRGTVAVIDDDVVGEIDARRGVAAGVAAHLEMRDDAVARDADGEVRAVRKVPSVLAASHVIAEKRVVAVLRELHREAGRPGQSVGPRGRCCGRAQGDS